jgi:hypothetical protein
MHLGLKLMPSSGTAVRWSASWSARRVKGC